MTAIHQDVNIALSETLIAALNGDDRDSLLGDSEDPAPLPDRHEIDFICGGPPWWVLLSGLCSTLLSLENSQSFSGANRFKKEDDERMTMIAAILSAIEHYQPKYFLIVRTPILIYHNYLSIYRKTFPTP